MEQPPPIQELRPETGARATTSVASRLVNVFAAPGEVFDEVKSSRSTPANWLVPVLLASLISAISAIIIFSQPAIIQQMREQQAKAMDQQVKAGKMTQAQADQALAIAEKFTGPSMMKIFGSVGAVVVSFIRLFWWALILWLLGRWFLKSRVPYSKMIEVAGLTMMISALGALVSVLLIVNVGRMSATPSLALFKSDFDFTRKTHLLLGIVNPFSFWQIGLMALGLSKLSGTHFSRAALSVFAFWLAQELLLISIGLGQFAL
jgi:hypothetical protein